MADGLSTYLYRVDKGAFPSIQLAIDKLAFEVNRVSSVDKDVEIIIGRGTFAGFSIPANMTRKFTSGAQLIIRSDGDYFPVIDWYSSPEDVDIGCDIKSNNPNIVLQGLRFNRFPVGIRGNINSHNLIVTRCIVSNSSNVGIYIQQCDNTVLTNNMIINGDFGAVLHSCKNVAVFHNSILLGGEIGDGSSALWVQLSNDYGNGKSDTGEATIVGNILWNMVGPSMTLFREDLENLAVHSDYNDIVRGDNAIIEIETKARNPNKPTPPKRIQTLLDWKREGIKSNPDGTALDGRSLSKNPRFLSSIRGKKKKHKFIDLGLLPNSPVLARVPAFHFSDPDGWVPSFMDPAYISQDILRNNRFTDKTAIGANEKASNAGFFGQDVFLSPRDITKDKKCDTDPIKDVVHNRLEMWFPKIRKGYFYSHEREYYLYARKRAVLLGACAVTQFELPEAFDYDKEFKVYIAGELITDPKYIDIVGKYLFLFHKDLPIHNGNEEIDIEGYIRRWDIGSNGFYKNKTHYVFKIAEGKTRYFLPEDYIGDGPVVITDDVVSLGDPDELVNREFMLEFDEFFQRTEIIFAHDNNKIYNGQFDYVLPSGNARGWVTAGNIVFVSGIFYKDRKAAVGDNVAYTRETGMVSTTIPIVESDYSLTFHAMGTEPDEDLDSQFGSFDANLGDGGELYLDDGGNIALGEPSSNSNPPTVPSLAPSGLVPPDALVSGKYNIKFYDHKSEFMGVTYSGTFVASGAWTRYGVVIGTKDDHPELTIEAAYPYVYLTGHEAPPDGARYMEISVENIDEDNALWLDGFKLEEGNRPTPYTRKINFDELTVEYETSTEDFFLDTRRAMGPTRSLMTQGFLCIPEMPAAIYSGPLTDKVTTLFEYRWPDGRINYLPWARVSGRDKLRRRSRFGLKPEKTKQLIYPAHPGYYPIDIDIQPDQIVARQGSKDGVGLSLIAVDESKNPFALGNFIATLDEPLGRFPGWLSKRFVGVKEQLGPEIYGQLDDMGSVSLVWIPPLDKNVIYVGRSPNNLRVKKGISSIRVNYRVNPDNFGNIIILDEDSKIIKTHGDVPISGVYNGSTLHDFTTIQLRYPPIVGSVKVVVDGIYYTETEEERPLTNQFYVDYLAAKVILRGKKKDVSIEYIPSYVFLNNSNPYRIFFYHDKVFGSYSGQIIVGYDAAIDLLVSVANPVDDTKDVTKKFTLIAQNSLLSDTRILPNPAANEY